MFFFESFTTPAVIMFVVVLLGLIGVNELSRRNLKWSMFLFVGLPIMLTPYWMYMDNEVSNWFVWVKVYSALMGAVGFMVIRFSNFANKHRWYLLFPPLILSINILEAVIREIQVADIQGVSEGLLLLGGDWNYFNAAAGILNIVTICGWAGIYAVTRGKNRDMVWPDMLWFWIIAYDIWNFAYIYNCLTANVLYTGVALLLSCTIPALWWAKGAWLQHRAHTLALWAMFMMTFPYMFTDSIYTVKVSYNPDAMWLISMLSFVANVALVVYQGYRIVQMKLNPIKDELYTDLAKYQEVAKA
ncbi:DUF5692 family protein [Vibrio ulleungensis]|uniref:Uncharacterized protein n=1 Tax=Vibrio ulleungensis TaxID=2807619 RepID=A0ABS2HJ23_9VIBR|nr:DUF5692 family protein [Vibrio ulleungensis]MBM7037515.1 hypothetical protein [Vibrio ulleungensis]